MSYLAGLIHKKQTAPEVGEWLAELADSPLAADPHSDTGADIVNLRRDYDRKTKLPQSLVEELAKLSVLGQQLWVEARKANDFARFRPLLERTIELKRQEAAAIGYDRRAVRCAARRVRARRENGRSRRACSPACASSSCRSWPRSPPARGGRISTCSRAAIPIDLQEKFGRQRPSAIGFDFDAGRLDVTDHPFCGGMGPRDVRLTTRYDENFLPGALFSTLHEAGHGIYEQGLPRRPLRPADRRGRVARHSRIAVADVGEPRRPQPGVLGALLSASAQQRFADALGDVSLDDFYFAINDVRPSLIRTESDEVTYNLHILIRFELELALLNDELRVADLPAAWNAKYREYLGIESPTDSDGVLQDVHWSGGAIGYFPTYSLGNLYAAQFFENGRARPGRPARHVPPRRIPAAPRLAAHEHPLARPPLPGRRTGPPRHRPAALARRPAASPARQIRPALRPAIDPPA